MVVDIYSGMNTPYIGLKLYEFMGVNLAGAASLHVTTEKIS